MQRSDTITALAKALAQAQAEIQNPTKNTKNTFFGSKYADLSEVLNVTREVLPTFGLSVVQNPAFDTQTMVLSLETILLHESGEWMSSLIQSPVPPQVTRDGKVLPLGPQAIGSAITYLRRYGVAAIVGIAQEDDDAESLSDPNRRGSNAEPPPRAQPQARQEVPAKGVPANQDDKIQRNTESIAAPVWSIEDQEQFSVLNDRLYKAFKAASTNEKYLADASRWKANKAKDPASIVLPEMLKWTLSLEDAAVKSAAQKSATDAPVEPAA